MVTERARLGLRIAFVAAAMGASAFFVARVLVAPDTNDEAIVHRGPNEAAMVHRDHAPPPPSSSTRRELVTSDPRARDPGTAGGVATGARTAKPVHVLLHVLDATTRSDLAGVEVVHVDPRFVSRERRAPSPLSNVPHAIVREHATSPVALDWDSAPENSRFFDLFVRAAEHGWGRVRVNAAIGGDCEVALHRTEVLNITVVGDVPGDVRVVLEDATESRDVASRIVSEAEHHASGWALDAGEYRVRAQRKQIHDLVWESQTESVVVPAGGSACVTLVLAATPLPVEPAEPVACAGILRAPGELELSNPTIDFDPADPEVGDSKSTTAVRVSGESVLGDRDTFTWSKKLLPGRYRATIRGAAFCTWIDVPASGNDSIVIDVPLLVNVNLALIDPTTRCAFDDYCDVHWLAFTGGAPADARMRPERSTYAQRADDGRYRLRAPAGRLIVEASAAARAAVTQEFAIASGTNDITLPMPRTFRFVLAARDRDDTLEGGEFADASIEPLDHEGAVLVRDGQKDRLIVRVSTAGRWRVTWPDIPGYERPAPREIEVAEDGSSRVEIALQRKR